MKNYRLSSLLYLHYDIHEVSTLSEHLQMKIIFISCHAGNTDELFKYSITWIMTYVTLFHKIISDIYFSITHDMNNCLFLQQSFNTKS